MSPVLSEEHKQIITFGRVNSPYAPDANGDSRSLVSRTVLSSESTDTERKKHILDFKYGLACLTERYRCHMFAKYDQEMNAR